jgi:hypothetical protein
MSEKVNENDFILSFAHRLDSYAATMTKRERLILAAIIMRSMDPLERFWWRDPNRLLEPDDKAILDRLEKEPTEV